MAKHWQSDGCYAELGVDGGTCSFLRYLSEVENWCPLTTTARTLTTRHKHNVSEWMDEVSGVMGEWVEWWVTERGKCVGNGCLST